MHLPNHKVAVENIRIPLILGSFLLASWLAVRLLNGLLPEGARVEARNV